MVEVKLQGPWAGYDWNWLGWEAYNLMTIPIRVSLHYMLPTPPSQPRGRVPISTTRLLAVETLRLLMHIVGEELGGTEFRLAALRPTRVQTRHHFRIMSLLMSLVWLTQETQ